MMFIRKSKYMGEYNYVMSIVKKYSVFLVSEMIYF